MRLRLLAAGLLPLSGCNCQDNLNQLNASITVTPPMLDFGKVPIGSTASLDLTLGNKGSFPLEVSSFAAPAPFIAPTSTVTRAIGTGTQGSIKVRVSFRPTALGDASGQLSFSTTDPKTKMVTVPLMGTGIQAAVTVDPTTVDFGDVLYNSMPQPKSAMVTISNPGTDKFDVTAVDLTNNGGGVFTIDAAAAKMTYAPGAHQAFTVGFTPKARGQVAGEVHVKTTAPNGGDVTVTLKANGVGPVIAICANVDGAAETCTTGGGHPRLSFKVDRGAMEGGQVRVLNTGDRDLTISEVLATGSGPSLIFTPSVPSMSSTVIMPGQDSKWRAVFAPNDYAYESVILTFVSDSADRSASSLVVEGKVKQPTIEVRPEVVTFNVSGNPGQMVPSSIGIFNCGDTTLVLGAITAMETDAANAFMFAAPPASGTMINPQNCMTDPAGATLGLTFAPPANGMFTGTMQVPSNDPVRPNVTVMVTGTKN